MALSLGVTSSASAQMTGIYLAYGERGSPGTDSSLYFTTWPVGIEECQANTPIQVQVNNAPFTGTTTALVYDLWTGGTGPAPAACESALNRRSTTGTPPCTRVAWDGPMVTGIQQVVSLNPQDLFGAACTMSGDRAFFLMAVSASNDTTTDLTTANYVALRVVMDATRPEPPNVTDAAGDNAIPVSWTLPTDTGTLSAARVFVDRTATACSSGDGGTGTSTLVPGATPPTTATLTVTGGSPTTATLDGASIGLEYGESAAVAVSVLDLARNESVLSNVACITRVRVGGFWDSYCSEQGLSEEECAARYNGCSASVGRRSVGAPLAIMGLVLLGAAVRSKKRKKS
jgi:hypothetical protein